MILALRNDRPDGGQDRAFQIDTGVEPFAGQIVGVGDPPGIGGHKASRRTDRLPRLFDLAPPTQ